MTDDHPGPISVRLGEVVPPEDAEDWTRPLTWVVATGMLVGPVLALAWFLVAPPSAVDFPLPLTQLLAAAIASGAAAAGATQLGRLRAATTTLGAALFAALLTVAVAAVLAGERQVLVASPPVGHAFGAGVAGIAGGLAGAGAAALVAPLRSRAVRLLPALLAGSATALATLAAIMPSPSS